MSSARLTTAVRAAAYRRLAEAAGGFGAVLRRGDDQAGELILLVRERGGRPTPLIPKPAVDGTQQYEIMAEPSADGGLDGWLSRRVARDPDLWILELDVVDLKQFIAAIGQSG